jgi:hypothetical protein
VPYGGGPQLPEENRRDHHDPRHPVPDRSDLAAAAAFGIGTNVRARVPNLGWLAVAVLSFAFFLNAI